MKQKKKKKKKKEERNPSIHRAGVPRGSLASPKSEEKGEDAAVFCVRRRSSAICRFAIRTSGVKTLGWDGGGGEGM
jgi:hypothetical protein